MKQNKNLSTEMLVDIFKAIKTCPNELKLLLFKKNNQKDENKILNQHWNKYTIKMLTFSLIIYINVNKAFKIRKLMNNCPAKYKLDGVVVGTDPKFWNLDDRVLQMANRDLLNENYLLAGLKEKIIKYFENNYRETILNSNNVEVDSPLFELFENEPRIIEVYKLKKSYLFDDNVNLANIVYSINGMYCLRTLTTDHIYELLGKRNKNFLVVGAGYIKMFDFPCHYYISGVRTFTATELFGDNVQNFFEDTNPTLNYARSVGKQDIHTANTVQLLKEQFEGMLKNLCHFIFSGTRLQGVKTRWTTSDNSNSNTFTHPTYYLDIFWGGKWVQLINVGIINQRLLNSTGNNDRVGFAFWFCFEIIAMFIHGINDIRNFWNPENVASSSQELLQPVSPNDLEFEISLPEGANFSPSILEHADED
ncbi:hypothetical protein ACQ4LE_005786 [Meloidogyne hapla]